MCNLTGGSPPRPGEVSLAHHGVLYLDELPEFVRPALEALREPLETGRIRIARAARHAEFPARFQLVAAMNPCPCGHLGSATRACRCTPDQIARYQGRVSGPLLDRIDLHVSMGALSPQALLKAPPSESSTQVRSRCAQAREHAMARQGCANHALQGAALEQHVHTESSALRFLEAAASRLGWSGRGLHRTLRIARTIADLTASSSVTVEHMAEALQYRQTTLVTQR